MCEEYLSSKEIMQKIADLKIRLALQQEFEQEVDELVAEVDPAGAGQSQPIREMEEKVLRDIAVHTSRRGRRPHRNGDFLDVRVLLPPSRCWSWSASVQPWQQFIWFKSAC